jgi:phosphohistidine phosphatase
MPVIVTFRDRNAARNKPIDTPFNAPPSRSLCYRHRRLCPPVLWIATMRRLMLFRHAKSELARSGEADLDRALAARGREVTPLMGAYIAQHAPAPDHVLVSTARRTRETWDLLAGAFDKSPPATFDKRIYEAPAKVLLAVLRDTPAETHTLLVVGHNPGMQELASLLMASGDITARQKLLEKFPTAALALLDLPIDRWDEIAPHTGRLDRFVTPRALALGADD